ncbi:hypothetical protein D9M71_789130 [compost metagenome]
MPSAIASALLQSFSRSTRTPVTSSARRQSARGMWMLGFQVIASAGGMFSKPAGTHAG